MCWHCFVLAETGLDLSRMRSEQIKIFRSLHGRVLKEVLDCLVNQFIKNITSFFGAYKNMNLQSNRNLLWVVGLGILFPLFFQLSGGLYRDPFLTTDSQGMLTKLPLPVSILTCMAALAFFSWNLKRARPAFMMIFGVIIVSFISLWLGGDGITPPQRKLLMIVQTVLPLVGLLLGQLVDDKDKVIPHAFLVVVSMVVPLQLFATWLQGGVTLAHYLYAFSIYSHFQYVTLIFVCAYAYSLTSLWSERKVWLCILAVPMLIYINLSYSFLTIFAYFSLLICFSAYKLWAHRLRPQLMVISLVMGTAAVLGGQAYFEKMNGQHTFLESINILFHDKFKSLIERKTPANVQERLNDWKRFGNGIIESKKTILVGHPQPMPREIRSSPHNWYIEITYTFGLVSLIPILTMIGYTAYLCWGQRRTLPAETWWLVAIVFYLVVIDSNFKVTLRQPYPGIFAYFMWGLLLSRLHVQASPKLSN